jgi:hypothetical protein
MEWREIEKEADRQAKIETLKILIIGIIFMASFIFGLIVTGVYFHYKSERELSEKIHSYNTITVNGEVFETSKIVNIDIQDQYNANDTVIFSMSDGTEVEVQEGSWTLKK